MKIKQLIINIISKWIYSKELNIIDSNETITELFSLELISEQYSVEPIIEQILVEPISEQYSVEPVIEQILVEPISEQYSVEPIIEQILVEPISELVLVESISELVLVEPVIEQTLVEPVIEQIFEPIYFETQLEIKKFIQDETGISIYQRGICYRIDEKTCILLSVDQVDYYDDDFTDINNIKYTLAGKSGNQDEKNKLNGNEQLLNINKTENIYVYRKNEIGFLWYGKYKIIDRNNKLHIGEDGKDRNIIVLTLRRL